MPKLMRSNDEIHLFLDRLHDVYHGALIKLGTVAYLWPHPPLAEVISPLMPAVSLRVYKPLCTQAQAPHLASIRQCGNNFRNWRIADNAPFQDYRANFSSWSIYERGIEGVLGMLVSRTGAVGLDRCSP